MEQNIMTTMPEQVAKQHLLQARNISKVFHVAKQKPLQALADIDMAIARGQITGIVGESGSGKSTFGEIAAGLQEPTAGEMFFAGDAYSTMSRAKRKHWRKNVQIVFQDPVASLAPHRRALDLVAEPFVIQRDPVRHKRDELIKRIKTLFDDVGLAQELLTRTREELSGGQCQRIAIARALALQPELIIFDESLSALDVPVQRSIADLLKELQKKYRMTYLFITHDLTMANYLCDFLYVMQQGRIADHGSSAYILQESNHPYVSKLRSAMLSVDERRFVR